MSEWITIVCARCLRDSREIAELVQVSSGVWWCGSCVARIGKQPLCTRGKIMYGEIVEIEEIAYHRNGISGVGFHVVNFLWREEGETTVHKMMGVVFELDGESEQFAGEGKFYNPPTAVFNRDLLAMNDIGFASNSFRGDSFDKELREAIEKDLAESR